MAKRESIIALMAVAGYHEDARTHMRLYCENRINKQVADDAFNRGREQKRKGMKCACHQCKKETK